MPNLEIWDMSASFGQLGRLDSNLLDIDHKIVIIHPLSKRSASAFANFIRISKSTLTVLIEMTASASMLVSRTSSASCTLMGTRILNVSLLLLRCFFCEGKTGY